MAIKYQWVLWWITKAEQRYEEVVFPTLTEAKAFGNGIMSDKAISDMRIERRRIGGEEQW